MDGASNDSNNGDGVVDGGDININDCNDANRDDGESIIDCDDNKDGGGGHSIADGGVSNNGGNYPDLGDDKTKAGYSGDTAGEDDTSNNSNGLMMVVVLILLIMIVMDENDADSNGDNNYDVANGVKNDGNINNPDGDSNDKVGDSADNDTKMLEETMMVTKMVLIMMMMMLKENSCNSIFLAFPRFLL